MAFQSRSELEMCRAAMHADQCLISGQLSLWIYEIKRLKLPVRADKCLPLCVQFSPAVALPRWSHPWSRCWVCGVSAAVPAAALEGLVLL